MPSTRRSFIWQATGSLVSVLFDSTPSYATIPDRTKLLDHKQRLSDYQRTRQHVILRCQIERERENYLFTYEEWQGAQQAYKSWLKQAEHILMRNTQAVETWREQGRKPLDLDWKSVKEKAARICENPRKALSLFPERDQKIYPLELKLINPSFRRSYLLKFYGVDFIKNIPAAFIILYLDRMHSYKRSNEKTKRK